MLICLSSVCLSVCPSARPSVCQDCGGRGLSRGGGGAGGVPDHDSQRKKTPFHISRGK